MVFLSLLIRHSLWKQLYLHVDRLMLGAIIQMMVAAAIIVIFREI
jgi:hypothetical protein